MKRIQLLSALLTLLIISSAPMQAQVANCGIMDAWAGVLTPPSTLDVMSGAMTPAPVLSSYFGGLPNIEYVAVNPNDLVVTPDGIVGPKILASNFTGIFDPAALGLVPGDQLAIQALSYDLSEVQNTIDVLLFGDFFGIDCCDLYQSFFEGDICDTLMAAGVDTSTDVTSLGDVLNFASAFGDNASVEATIYIIDSVVNPIVYSGAPCAGNAICYTATAILTYNIVPAAPCSVVPSGLTASVSSFGVTLSWNSLAADGVLGYRVCGRIVGAPGLKCGPVIAEPASSFNLPSSSLAPGTSYEWKVKGGCALDGSVVTPFSLFSTFTTPAARFGEPKISIRKTVPISKTN